MKSKIFLTGLVSVTVILAALMFSGSLWAGGVGSAGGEKFEYPFKGEGAGYVLLNWVITPIKKDDPPKGKIKTIQDITNMLITDAIKARAAGEIDEYFFQGFTRMLLVADLGSIYDKLDYKDLVLDYIIRKEMDKFISRKGLKQDAEKSLCENMGRSMVEEILALKKYLDKQAETNKTNKTSETSGTSEKEK